MNFSQGYRFLANQSLKRIIIFLMLSVTLIPFFANSIVTVSVTRKATLQEEQQKLASQAFTTESILLSKFSSYEALLKLLSTSPNINNYKAFKGYSLLIKLQLQEIIATHSEFSNLFVVTEDNEHLYYRDPVVPAGNDTQSEWYQAARNSPKKVLWDAATAFDHTTNNWITVFRMGYKNSSTNSFSGVVTVNLKLDDFSDELRKQSQYDNLIRVIISNGNDVVASSNSSWVGSKFPFTKTDFTSGTSLKEIAYNQQNYFGGIEEIPNMGLRVAVLQLKTTTLAHLNQILLLNWIMIGIIGIVYVITAIMLSYIITRPILEIYRSMEVISNKDFTVNELNAKASWAKEFKILKMSFNNMYGSYKDLILSIIYSSGKIIDHSEKLKGQAEMTALALNEASSGISEICKGATENASLAETGLFLTHDLSNKINLCLHNFENIMNTAAQASGFNQETISSTEELIAHSQLSHSSNLQVMDTVSALIASLKAIDMILESMNKISKETNILSLNATIEAARVGELGKGFSVVAEEIRQLSSKSSLATKQISQILEVIHTHSNKITGILESTKTLSDKQLNLVQNNQGTIMRNIQAFEEVVGEIEVVKGQNDIMAVSISKLSEMMQNTAAISQETSALTEQLSATIDIQVNAASNLLNTSTQLSELTDSLNHTTQLFKLDSNLAKDD